jgi:hypothetical protein
MEHLDPVGSLSHSVPFLSALLFAVHPIHTECVRAITSYVGDTVPVSFQVANIVGRAELLMTAIALIAFLQYNTAMKTSVDQVWKRLATVSALTLASMLCKEQGITIMASRLRLNDL